MDKYLENIGLDDSGITGPSGILEINQEFSFKLIEDLQEVSFNSLYAHLLVKFYDAGIFEKNGIKIKKSIINKVNKWFLIRNNLKASNNSDYINMKAWVNSIYNNELRDYTPMIFELYRQYMRQFWSCGFLSYNVNQETLMISPFSVSDTVPETVPSTS